MNYQTPLKKLMSLQSDILHKVISFIFQKKIINVIGQFDSCFDVLKKTEYSLLLHTESILKQNLKSNENLNFLSITLNNLGCYFVWYFLFQNPIQIYLVRIR
jgi:hypothetical protein